MDAARKSKSAAAIEPSRDCPLCPRLVDNRQALRRRHPDWFNAPVPSSGPLTARLLIVGLAPGVAGANRTGRPFTGDAAGDFLNAKLVEFGFARGKYDATRGDSLRLIDCRITNAVRCVPPANRPTASEVRNCNRFLRAEIAAMRRLHVILALGHVAHRAVCLSVPSRPARRFSHGAVRRIASDLWLADCYHCSRQNLATGVLTERMFDAVLDEVTTLLR